MSIPNLLYKIKSKTGIDRMSIVYLLIIIGVGISSFCLGRFSTDNYIEDGTNRDINDINMAKIEDSLNKEEAISLEQPSTKEKRYVASKNGKMYYSIGCSGASRIKPENEVWFNTALDAERSGFQLASSCK